MGAIDFSTMRRSLRQLAAVKPSRFLEAGSPTGLTGLFTHNAPRSTLLYLYSSTLVKLKAFPESSLYRQSTEALTKHRMAIVSAVEPEGYKAWAEKARQTIKEHPEVFNTAEGSVAHDEGPQLEGSRTAAERKGQSEWSKERPGSDVKTVKWDPEPPLTSEQV